MIKYEVKGNVVIAKFYQEGKTLKRIWEDSLYDLVDKYLDNTAFQFSGYINKVVDKVMADRKLVGMAKLHPHDEFDLEEGKRIARKDLMNRFNIAKMQLKKEILYCIKHEVTVVKNRM